MQILNPSRVSGFKLLSFSFLVAGLVSCKTTPELPPGDPGNGGLLLPGGFEALVVVDSIGHGRHIAVNDNGDIYVKLTFNERMNGGAGTVGLRDLNHDGKADTIVYFGDYKDEGGLANAISIHDGYLYTSTVRQVLKNKLTPGKLIPETKTEVVFTDTDPDVAKNWHTTKPLAFDHAGNLYIPFGSPDDACQDKAQYGPVGIPGGRGLDPCPELETHAGIWRFDASKTGLTQADGFRFSTGIRSVVGMAWNPMDNQLYAVMNGIDNFHTLYPNLYSSWQAAVLPSEPLLKVTEGSDFGWPYAYYDHMQKKNVLQPGYGGDGKMVGRAANFDAPVLGFPGHWAPMDILFYEGNQFPSRYKEGAFIAFHGSTDRSPYPQAGFIVCFVPFKNNAPVGTWEIFADGFAGVDTVVNTGDAHFRPMGLATGPDGSLYISESNKGKIWRVMYKGDKNVFSEDQLQEMKKREVMSYIKTPDEAKDNLNKGSNLEGGILYDAYCANCHQRNGKGDNNRFPPLAGADWVTGDKDRLISVILNGLQGEINVDGKKYRGAMPPHAGILDDHAVASISTYIRSHFRNRSGPVSPTDVKKIREASRE